MGKVRESPSPQEAAVIARIAWRTFYALLEKGRVSAVRRGGTWELLPGWERAARDWNMSEQRRLRRSGLNKLYAVARAKKEESRSPAPPPA